MKTRRRRRAPGARGRRRPGGPKRAGRLPAPARRRAASAGAPARPPPALRPAGLSRDVLEVLRVLRAAGHRSWVVGGTVRDLLLGRGAGAAADLATPATPQQVMALFPRVIPTGVEHGTVTVLSGGATIEITTFRGEGTYLDGRRPSSVTFHGDLEADLGRRDFTINALAWDPLAGEFRDPFGGRDHLRRRLIRAVGDPAARFAEDGLRPLRALRFAAQLGYAIERHTLAAMAAAAPAVRLVSAERVADELSKLLAGSHAGTALRLLLRTGLLGMVLGPLAPLQPEVASHAVEVAADVADRPLGPGDRPDPVVLRLAALLHVIPAPAATEAVVARRLPGRLAAEVGGLLGERGCLRDAAPYELPAARADVRRWLSRVGPERAPGLLDLWEADARHLGRGARAASAALARLRARAAGVLREQPPLSGGNLALDGRAVMEILGLGPGREVGEALRHLLDRVLEDPRRNDREMLAADLRSWWARRPPRS